MSCIWIWIVFGVNLHGHTSRAYFAQRFEFDASIFRGGHNQWINISIEFHSFLPSTNGHGRHHQYRPYSTNLLHSLHFYYFFFFFFFPFDFLLLLSLIQNRFGSRCCDQVVCSGIFYIFLFERCLPVWILFKTLAAVLCGHRKPRIEKNKIK